MEKLDIDIALDWTKELKITNDTMPNGNWNNPALEKMERERLVWSVNDAIWGKKKYDKKDKK